MSAPITKRHEGYDGSRYEYDSYSMRVMSHAACGSRVKRIMRVTSVVKVLVMRVIVVIVMRVMIRYDG